SFTVRGQFILVTRTGQTTVDLSSSAGTRLEDVRAVETPAPTALPARVSSPLGAFEFTALVVGPGGTATVTLDLPAGVPLNTYYKYGPTPEDPQPHWYEFLFDERTGLGAVIVGNRVTLHLADGQRGDADLLANGVIVDPGTPAFSADAAFVTALYHDVL